MAPPPTPVRPTRTPTTKPLRLRPGSNTAAHGTQAALLKPESAVALGIPSSRPAGPRSPAWTPADGNGEDGRLPQPPHQATKHRPQDPLRPVRPHCVLGVTRRCRPTTGRRACAIAGSLMDAGSCNSARNFAAKRPGISKKQRHRRCLSTRRRPASTFPPVPPDPSPDARRSPQGETVEASQEQKPAADLRRPGRSCA